MRLDHPVGRPAFAVRRIDGRVQQHGPRQPLAVERTGQNRHEAAEAVATMIGGSVGTNMPASSQTAISSLAKRSME